MASFNRVILMGNLTRDPELRQAQNGTVIVKAGLAVNERMPDGQGGWKEEPSFFDIVIFGKRAEAFGRFMTKGRPVLIEGKLRQGRWQDRETGQNRSKVEIIVDSWEFAGGGRGDDNQGQGGHQQAQGSYQQRQPAAPAQGGAPAPAPAPAAPDFPGPSDFGGGQGGFPDDVPF